MKQLYMQNGLSAEDAEIVAKTLAKSARAGSPLGAGIAENGLSDFATFFANIWQTFGKHVGTDVEPAGGAGCDASCGATGS